MEQRSWLSGKSGKIILGQIRKKWKTEAGSYVDK